MTFEEYCVEQFLDSIEPADLCEMEFPTLDIATKVAEGLADGSFGLIFYVFKLDDCDFYSVECITKCNNTEQTFRELYDVNLKIFKTITT